jgi:uncharacterized protein YggE
MVGTIQTAFDNIDSLDFTYYPKLLKRITLYLLAALSLCIFFSIQYSIVIAQSYSTDVSDAVSSRNGMSTNSTVYTSGSSFTRIAPDRVIISIGVETTGKTASDALYLNSGLMNNIISELRNDGLRPNETSTSLFNIFPLYNYTESGTRLNVSGFTVTNTVQIESSNLDNVSQWIDTAVASGANSINNIDFSVTEKKLEDTRNKLIVNAIANAKQKAETAAGAVQLNITGVNSIVIDSSTTPPPLPPEPFYKDSLSAKEGALLSSTPIIAGEQEVSVSISGIFSMG